MAFLDIALYEYRVTSLYNDYTRRIINAPDCCDEQADLSKIFVLFAGDLIITLAL